MSQFSANTHDSAMSSLVSFLAGRRRARGDPAPTQHAGGSSHQSSVIALAAELSALDTLSLRNMLLEERKAAPSYKALFPAPEATKEAAAVKKEEEASSGNAPMEVEPSTSPANPAEAVSFRLVPEYKVVATTATAVKVVVSLKATADVVKPANVALVAVVDKSRSMQGHKIDLVKGTVDFLADQLGPQDALSLVTYSDAAKRDLPLLLMTPAATVLAKAVNAGITTDGCTALHDGLLLAIKEHSADAAAASRDADSGRRVRSVFLCTDGLPNVGPTDALGIVSAMRAQLSGLAATDEPVSIHTFGFGSDHDPKLLQAIAEAGGGIYYYISDVNQIPEAFGDALGGLLSVVASNVRINVTTIAPADAGADASAEGACSITKVESGGVLEAPGAQGNRQACIKFSDLFAEENREVLLELQLGAGGQQDTQQLIKVEVSYTNPATGAVSSSSQMLAVSRSPAPPADQQRDELVVATAARFQVAEAVKEAGAESEAGRLDGAEQVLQKAVDRLSREGAGEAHQMFVAQLSDMAKTVSAARASKTMHARACATTSMAAYSNAMVQQRSAAVGLTSFVPPAPAAFAFAPPAPGSAAAAAPLFGAAPGPAGGSAGAPQQQQQQQQYNVSSAPFTSNAMRQRMQISASEYVTKRAKQ